MILDPQRTFSPEPGQRAVAVELYKSAAYLPILSPHGHVDASIFVDPDFCFPNPAEMLVIPDHYILRILHSQGVPYEKLGILRKDARPVKTDPRSIWQVFAANYFLFNGTPTGMWLEYELAKVFGVTLKLNAETAQTIYDQVSEKIGDPEFNPCRLYERFGIEVLCTTNASTDTLEDHQALRASTWRGHILPTFRPDDVVDLYAPGWRNSIERLALVSGIEVVDYASFIHALEQRRAFFKSLGATATDQAAVSADTTPLPVNEAEAIFQRALKGNASSNDASRFTASMLTEMARMSVEDGLVMQLHIGAFRNHDRKLFDDHGPNLGADFPVQVEFTNSLRPLLNLFGNTPGFNLILFTLDETSLARELAPMASYYPALKLGAPWWFLDSLNGMRNYFDHVVGICGIHNTAGFNDDTRAFPSIPARHDLWRRACANWLAGLVRRGTLSVPDAQEMMFELAVGLARRAYKL